MEDDSPLRPDRRGNKLKDVVSPQLGETVIGKKVNSSFIGTNLHENLLARGVRNVVLGGLTTPHCVSTTARMAANLGYKTYVLSDGTAAFQGTAHDGTIVSAEEMHFYSLAAIHGEFATVLESSSLLKMMAEPEGAGYGPQTRRS
jgi:nicotinamidase-related amidase